MSQNHPKKPLDTVMEDSAEIRVTGQFGPDNNSMAFKSSETRPLIDSKNLSVPENETVAFGQPTVLMTMNSKDTGKAVGGRSASVYSQALSRKDLEIVRAEMAKNEFTFSKKDKIVSWTVLITLLLAQISNQWQRFMISTAYNYKLDDEDEKDPYYMMSVDIPGFTSSKYGLIAGALFTSLFSVTVLFSGVLSDNFSRRLILAFAAMLWSATSLTTAIS